VRTNDILLGISLFNKTNKVQQLNHIYPLRCTVFFSDQRIQHRNKTEEWQQSYQ